MFHCVCWSLIAHRIAYKVHLTDYHRDKRHRKCFSPITTQGQETLVTMSNSSNNKSNKGEDEGGGGFLNKKVQATANMSEAGDSTTSSCQGGKTQSNSGGSRTSRGAKRACVSTDTETDRDIDTYNDRAESTTASTTRSDSSNGDKEDNGQNQTEDKELMKIGERELEKDEVMYLAKTAKEALELGKLSYPKIQTTSFRGIEFSSVDLVLAADYNAVTPRNKKTRSQKRSTSKTRKETSTSEELTNIHSSVYSWISDKGKNKDVVTVSNLIKSCEDMYYRTTAASVTTAATTHITSSSSLLSSAPRHSENGMSSSSSDDAVCANEDSANTSSLSSCGSSRSKKSKKHREPNQTYSDRVTNTFNGDESEETVSSANNENRPVAAGGGDATSHRTGKAKVTSLSEPIKAITMGDALARSKEVPR